MKLMKKFMKKSEGFTLVELIVVIAILAILAGVAVPAYSAYIKKANDSAVETELTALSTAVMAANATAGSVSKIEIVEATANNATTYTVTVTAESFASDFDTDLALYYSIGAVTTGTGTKSFTISAPSSWVGSSYDENNKATWTGSDWA